MSIADWNVTVYGFGKNTEERKAKFRNINYNNCPVCGQPLDNGWKIVRGYVLDHVVNHEFRVCVHKRCGRKLTYDMAQEVLSYDPEYGDISFDYQDRIAREITKDVGKFSR